MTIEEIEAAVMGLPEDQRARLAAELITSLPAVLDDVDDGQAEAERRLKELKENPSSGKSWDEVRREIGR